MSNYTRPNDPDYVDTPEDWLNGSLIFARALSILLEEGTGIVVNMSGDMKVPGEPEATKALVYKYQGMIHIESTEEDWPEGDMMRLSTDENC